MNAPLSATLRFQPEEMDVLRLALTAALKDPQTAQMIFGNTRSVRSAYRCQLKLDWAANAIKEDTTCG